MRWASVLALGALLPSVLAASCSTTPQYNSVNAFNGSNGCMPGGYYQAADLGNTDQATMLSRCGAQCASLAQCDGFVGQLWKAADSNLYTGQCYFYYSLPATPRLCGDSPSVILAEQKDRTLSCLSDPAAAGAVTNFCRSYISIRTVTKYTSTFTPRYSVTVKATVTKSTTTLTKTTSTSFSTATQTETSTSITTSISRTTSFTTTTTGITTTVESTSYTATGTVSGYTAANTPLRKRAAAPPSCLTTSNVPASRISSVCSCLSIPPVTVSLVSTAASSALTVTSTSTAVLSFTTTSKTTTTAATTTKTTTVIPTTTVSTISSFATTVVTSASTVATTATVATVSAVPASYQPALSGTGRSNYWYLSRFYDTAGVPVFGLSTVSAIMYSDFLRINPDGTFEVAGNYAVLTTASDRVLLIEPSSITTETVLTCAKVNGQFRCLKNGVFSNAFSICKVNNVDYLFFGGTNGGTNCGSYTIPLP